LGEEVNIDSILNQKTHFLLQGSHLGNKVQFNGYQIQDSLILKDEKVYFFSKTP